MAIQTKAKFVAIVDDDALMRSALQGLFKSAAMGGQGLWSQADIRMPGMSGLELQAKLNADHCRIPTIFITAHGDAKMRLQAMRAGAVEFLAKPFDDEVLLESVRAAMES